MPRSYFFIVLRRSLGFWIGLRLLLLVVMLVFVAYASPPDIDLAGALASPGTCLLMIMLTVGVQLFDAKAAGEDLLLANFGISPRQVGLRALILPSIGEALVLLLLAGR